MNRTTEEQCEIRLNESGYSLNEIETILMEEVFPILIPNMAPVAGEWAGFDEEWLHETILKSEPPGVFRKLMNRINFCMIKGDWKKISMKFKTEKGW